MEHGKDWDELLCSHNDDAAVWMNQKLFVQIHLLWYIMSEMV